MNENKNHWDNLNINYDKVWQSVAKHEMHKKEMAFISYYLKIKKPKTILDIGCGTGRILNNLINYTSPETEIYAIDISEKMVKLCREKFKDEKKIKSVEVVDIAKDQININKNFDFITAIRVLKYNKNWPEILEKIYQQLNPGGIFIFTMPNKNSINRFADRYSSWNIPIYRTTPKEIKYILKDIGYKILEIRSFTKIPDFFYDKSTNKFFAKLIIFLEKALEIILGKVFLGRILFLAVEKEK
jgi:ubiquinone/menaquinone biosynthesis C-methylase UbiE